MVALTDEERKAVKDAIILPMVLTVLERDKKIIQEQIKLNQPYLDIVERAMKQAHGDLVKARAFMRKKGIKIYDKERDVRSITHKFICRGYHHEDTFLWEYLQIQVEVLIGYYISGDMPKEYGV